MSSLSLIKSLSSPSLSEQSLLASSSSIRRKQSEIEELRSKILTSQLNPDNYQPLLGVNPNFQDLSKSLDQQKFSVAIGKIILSYLGDEAASVEGEFTLSDSIEFIKERDRSEINTKSKKFSDLIRQQIEQELKNKEIPENYKELLESIEKRVSLDITLKVIKVLDLKKKIEFFLLLKDLSKERIEVLQKACKDQNLLEFFQEVFNWIKKYQENRKEIYPTREIEKFIKLSVQNNKEEMAIELAGKILYPSIKDWAFEKIFYEFFKGGRNEKEKKERYNKAKELINRIDPKDQSKVCCRIVRALLKLEENEKEESQRHEMAIEWAYKISDLNDRDFIFADIVSMLLENWKKKSDKEKNKDYIRIEELIYKISNQEVQNRAIQEVRYYEPFMPPRCIII